MLVRCCTMSVGLGDIRLFVSRLACLEASNAFEVGCVRGLYAL